MKSIVISQPRYLPSLNYFHRMMIADHFIYLDSVQYTPRDYENRNKVPINNEAKWLTVPVIRDAQTQKISETYIDNDKPWQKKHLTTFERVYSKAPFFKALYPDIVDIYQQTWDRLIDLDVALIDYVCQLLNIKCQFSLSSQYNLSLSGEQLLMALCQREEATHYVSGSLGRNYLTTENWDQIGIQLRYHDYHFPTYKQINCDDFIPWLNVFDLIFNHGPNESIDIMCSGNDLSLKEEPNEENTRICSTS